MKINTEKSKILNAYLSSTQLALTYFKIYQDHCFVSKYVFKYVYKSY